MWLRYEQVTPISEFIYYIKQKVIKLQGGKSEKGKKEETGLKKVKEWARKYKKEFWTINKKTKCVVEIGVQTTDQMAKTK